MPIPKPLLSGTLHDYGIGHLVDMPTPAEAVPTERQLMNLTLPPWQRPEVWSEAQKRRFVEGVFLGLGTGSYVVHASDWDDAGRPKPMSGWLLDGQQRISALRDFIAGDLVVFGTSDSPRCPYRINCASSAALFPVTSWNTPPTRTP